MGVAAGQVFRSTLGTDLRVTVVTIDSRVIVVSVERKLMDKTTGAVTIQERERRIHEDNWPRFIKAYEQVPAS